MRRVGAGTMFRATRFALLVLLLAVVCGWSATAATAGTSKILAFGDSLTAGFGLPSEQGFPAQLEKRLRAGGIDVQVINGGQSGDTTAGGLARLDWSLADKPDLVILELGANDMLRAIPPASVRANLDKLIGKIKESGAKLLLTGMQASPNWGKKYEEEFNPIYPELARLHGVALYPFFLEGVVMKLEFNQPDGLHPNARGVALIVEGIAPCVAELLGERS